MAMASDKAGPVKGSKAIVVRARFKNNGLIYAWFVIAGLACGASIAFFLGF